MPLFHDALERMRASFEMLEAGKRPEMFAIGWFSEQQFRQINEMRLKLRLQPIEKNEIVFIGRHIFESRRVDNEYSIEDMLTQIHCAMSSESVPNVHWKMTAIENPDARQDGYGNMVHDRGIFECSNRKPRAELYSVIPEGDGLKKGMKIQKRAPK